MEAQQLNLKDIHLPNVIGWWPPAIGWWLLAILIPLLCFLLFWLYKRITRKTAVKTAKKLLLKIKQDAQLSDRDKLTQLSALLRRVAISVSPRQKVASLTGEAWLKHLDSSVTGTPFTQGEGHVFADQYKKISSAELGIPSLIKVCEDWLKAQKNKK
jgi:cbb3-type cytochrome oxidase subunit 3